MTKIGVKLALITTFCIITVNFKNNLQLTLAKSLIHPYNSSREIDNPK